MLVFTVVMIIKYIARVLTTLYELSSDVFARIPSLSNVKMEESTTHAQEIAIIIILMIPFLYLPRVAEIYRTRGRHK